MHNNIQARLILEALLKRNIYIFLMEMHCEVNSITYINIIAREGEKERERGTSVIFVN